MSKQDIEAAIAAVCDASSAPMVVVNVASGALLHVNPAARAELGWNPARLTGDGDDALTREPVPAQGSVRVAVRFSAGRTMSARIDCKPLPQFGGELTLLTISPDDANVLRQRLDLTHQVAHVGIWEWDVRTDEVVWSDKFLEMVGLDRERFRADSGSFLGRLHPEDVQKVDSARAAHLRDGTPYDVVYRLRHENGHYINVRSLGQATWDEQGRPVRMVGNVEDISDQVATLEALSETEKRFRQLAANIPGAIYRYVLHLDGQDEIEYMSPGCVDMWELDAETIGGDPTLIWQMILEEDVERMLASVQHSAATLTPWDLQYRLRTPSGKLKWLHGRGVPTRLSEGSVMWNSLVLEITEQKKTEQALQESRELFYRAQKTESLGQLTGGLAHDFNNLLAVVLGNLELLRDADDSIEAEDFIDDALNAVQRGRQLTQSLLAFARRATLQPERLAIDSVIAELRPMLMRTVPESIGIELQVASDLPWLVLDRAALESALLNLVLNARDAVDTNGRIDLVVARRSLEADNGLGLKAGEHVEFIVRDNGTGIDGQMLERVFEPFFTTKKEGEGNGLGLSMVEGFARQSGGGLEIQSRAGEGTAVGLLFPVPTSAELQAARPEPATDGVNWDSQTGGTILVVEDDEDVRRMLCRLLTAEGYATLAAGDGDQAESLYDTHRGGVDLVLTDSVMPGPVQGGDLATYVKALDPDLPVVLLSGYVNLGEDDAGTRGVDARLDKPIGKQALLATVRQMIGSR